MDTLPTSATVDHQTPNPGRAWVVTGCLAVLSVVGLSTRGLGWNTVVPLWQSLPVLALAFAATEHWTLPIRRGDKTQGITITELPLVLGLLLTSPLAVVLGRLVGQGAALHFLRRQGPAKLSFNLALGAADIAAAIVVLAALMPANGLMSPAGALATTVAMVAVVLTSNGGVTAVISAVAGRVSPELLVPGIRAGLPPAMASGSLALLIGYVLTHDPWLAGPLGVALTVVIFGFRAHATLETEHIGLERLSDFASTITVEKATPAHIRAMLDEAAALLDAELVEMVVEGDEPFHHVAGSQPVTGVRGPVVNQLQWDHSTPTLYPAARAGTRSSELTRRTGLRDGIVVAFPPVTAVRGALMVANRRAQRDTFSQADLTVAESLASHLAVAYANARLAMALRQRAQESEQRARHDTLTGLPNRSALLEHIRSQPAKAEFCVLLMDLDRFKQVNDTLGHAAGDALLIEVARRLQRAVGSGPLLTRLGGDEFAAVVQGGAAQGLEVAQRIVAALTPAIPLEPAEVSIGVSVGVSHAPGHGTTAPDLLHNADLAMYRAKGGDSSVEVFHHQDDTWALRQLQLASDLPKAISAGELTLDFQPIIGLRDSRLWSLEGLARWRHPEFGPITPDEFIPIAERSGTVRELTIALTRRALAHCTAWRAGGEDMRVSLNLSPRILVDESLPGVFATLLREAGLPGSALALDVTEDGIAADPGRTLPVIAGLADLGISVVIQQFGTGFMSLAILAKLRVDTLKIAPSSVDDRSAPRGDGIMRSILQLGHSLGMQVVAAGVETTDDVAWLSSNGCDAIQGHVVAGPMSPSAASSFVAAWPHPGRAQPVGAVPGRAVDRTG